MIKVEYLLPFNTSDGICKNITSLKSLISSNSNFKFKNNKIYYKGSPYTIDISLHKVDNEETAVFHIVFTTTKISNKFRKMLKTFRKTIGPFLKDNILLIWDGVSLEWLKELYPKIYNVENSLRKLISKFMLINLGMGWHKSYIPKDITDSIKQRNYKPSHNILYEVDFIQLAYFLFKPYYIKDPQKLPEILSDIIENGLNEEKKQEIVDFIPKNNWDRYFSSLVEIESEELNKKWEKLYEIRNKVAHNKSISFIEYENGINLCKELDKIINKAIDNIDKIKIPERDKESIGIKTMETIDEFIDILYNKYFNDNENKIVYKRKDKNTVWDSIIIIDKKIKKAELNKDKQINNFFPFLDNNNLDISNNNFNEIKENERNNQENIKSDNNIKESDNIKNINKENNKSNGKNI